MAGPVENIASRGAGAAARTEGVAEAKGADGKVSDKFDQMRQDGAAEGTPKVAEAGQATTRQMEHDLRKRLETAKSTNPAQLYGPDLSEARRRIEGLQRRVEGLKKSPEASPLRDRLAAIEAQFAESEKRLSSLPEVSSPRELLAMQTEMYKLGQNIEILSKVVDAATSGVKSTLQMQV